MDKAPAYGAGDSSFDPWQTRILMLTIIAKDPIFRQYISGSLRPRILQPRKI